MSLSLEALNRAHGYMCSISNLIFRFTKSVLYIFPSVLVNRDNVITPELKARCSPEGNPSERVGVLEEAAVTCIDKLLL